MVILREKFHCLICCREQKAFFFSFCHTLREDLIYGVGVFPAISSIIVRSIVHWYCFKFKLLLELFLLHQFSYNSSCQVGDFALAFSKTIYQ
jgi:hypothetical protein